MTPGTVLLGRFEVETVAGAGGMGVVYRARDLLGGQPVALKVMAKEVAAYGDAGDVGRFGREARLLAELNDPGIVRYVAHGATPDGEPFLAMEWLDGEDLSQLLGRRGLAPAEAVDFIERVARGLEVAHRRGIVHRDIKPSNIFLVDGDPARPKLLDFGIARAQRAWTNPSYPLTLTGVMLGTVGYMAPEQAIADTGIDSRADVFSLGAVFFECLTGQAPFSGPHLAAVLARVLHHDAPRVRDLRPDLPLALDLLVGRMLAKRPSDRPASAGAVLSELQALGVTERGTLASTPVPSAKLSDSEKRFVSAILATRLVDSEERLTEVLQCFHGKLVSAENGIVFITLSAQGKGDEHASNAAACALSLRATFPAANIALVTGRSATSASDSLAHVLRQTTLLLARSRHAGVQVDALTWRLLRDRFDVREQDGTHTLHGVLEDLDAPRTLLGRAMPCIGREKELGLLEANLRESVDDRVPRAVVVVGPAGQGKSRLAHEFIARVRRQPNIRILSARTDPVGAGSAFLLVRQIVRRAVGARQNESDATLAALVRARAAAVCPGANSARIGEFLCELVGSSFPDAPSPQLRAARNSPQIMNEWLRRSFAEWLSAEAAAQPTLLVLEDLHWGDLPSVTYLADVLQGQLAKSIMVLALARPEVNEVFPGLWAAAEKQEITLGRLTPAAAERLVRAATGDALSPAVLTSIVRRGEGNAFYLEELVRCVVDANPSKLPDTVLALVESRLHQLGPQERRLVRAASIFGEVFWKTPVETLLGASAGDVRVEASLRWLVEREVFEQISEPTSEGEPQYAFRHSLLREAAYAMLTDEDRAIGHRLAGDWLEAKGGQDAQTMAHHFERGGAPARALPWIIRAQQMAYDGGNVQAAVALAERGAELGATGVELGHLRLVEGLALSMRGDWTQCVRREAMSLLPAGSSRWFLAAGSAFIAGMFLGDPTIMGPLLQEILAISVPPEPSGPYGLAVFTTCIGLVGIGQTAMAKRFLERAEAASAHFEDIDPVFTLRVQTAAGFLQIADGDLGGSLSSLSSAKRLAEATGDAWGRASASAQYVAAIAETGACEETERAARDVLSFCEERRLDLFSGWARFYFAAGLRNAGRTAESEAVLRRLLDRPDPLLVSSTRALLAQLRVAAGDLDGAAKEVAVAQEKGWLFPAVRAASSAALALAELRRGRPELGLTEAAKGLAAAEESAWPRDKSILHLVHAECLHATDRVPEARAAIATARERVCRAAATLNDDSLRVRLHRGGLKWCDSGKFWEFRAHV